MKLEIPKSIQVTINGLISRGIAAVNLREDGHVLFTLTDGTVEDLGAVAPGTPVQSAYEAAQTGGYTGTITEFYADLAAMQGLSAELEALL